MWPEQVLHTDSGLPMSSAHASKFDVILPICLKDKPKCWASPLQHKQWSMGIKSGKKNPCLFQYLLKLTKKKKPHKNS